MVKVRKKIRKIVNRWNKVKELADMIEREVGNL